ncbi:MAG: exodeoxyribonuclease VII large subunit [Candidatus Aminicenantes bacterium]|jgi:exodeoxyribonuclease VII large subunit
MKWINVVINGQEVSVAFDENSIHIYNAYPIKDDLKMRGYRWNPADKSWFLHPRDIDIEMKVLENNLQPSSPTAAPPVKKGEKSELAVLPESYSVAELRNRLDRLIREGIRGNVWVRGVIASEIKNYKWASYLDLKDEDENRHIFFRVEIKKQNLEKINLKLQESGVALALEPDLPVFCNVEVYLPLRNVVDIRLSLLDILPEYTQSKIRNQRDITLDQLKKENILENQKRLLLPAFISRLGLITSEQGTSIRDIRAGLHPYQGKYQFFFVDSRMEGANAVDSIIQAITFLEDNAGVELDAVIIARGGGSEQSLAIFNDLRLCRKVCNCPIPILTAIGHDKDFTAIEECSWLTPTPSTPSGIGKYLQNRYLNLQEQLSGTVTQLIHHFTTVHQREMEKIKAFLKHIPVRVSSYFKWKEEGFFNLTRELERSMGFTVRDHERRVGTLTRQLMNANRELLIKNKANIQSLAALILSRVDALNQREVKYMEKTILKLDFEKRHRVNQKQREDIREKARSLLTQVLKTITNVQKNIEARIQLVKASNPDQILKKGFTLTLDEEKRVIKSVNQFNQKQEATLKFHDGSTKIKKISE